MFPNFWQKECSGGARRRVWKRSGLCRTLNATVAKVDNLVWLPRARKNENWSRGPTVDELCAGTCAYRPRLYGDPGPTKVLPGPTVTFFSAGTHGCRPKVGDPQMPQREPRDDLRPLPFPIAELLPRGSRFVQDFRVLHFLRNTKFFSPSMIMMSFICPCRNKT